VTGLRIINGGGRAEVQAAHIQPVADDGPDVQMSRHDTFSVCRAILDILSTDY
jgi:hypothetical protein